MELLTRPDISWEWDQAEYSSEWHEPIMRIVSRYIVRGSCVLEIGAGGSHTLAGVAGRLGCRAVGLEPDENGIRKTIEFGELEKSKVLMVQGDGFHLPFDSNTFDVVYSLGLIEHFPIQHSRDLLLEHVRVLKSNGRAIVAVPNTLNLPHTIRKSVLGAKYEFYPERSYTPRQLKKAIEEVGLRNVELDGLLPLWGLAMYKRSWRIMYIFERLGVTKRINSIRNARLRGSLGYMTYAIATK